MSLSRQRGFSLLECMLFVALLSIIGQSAMMGWHKISEGMKLQSAEHSIKAGLIYSREYALVHAMPVTYCGSSSQHSCNGEWGKGQVSIDGRSRVLRAFSSVPKGIVISWRGGFGKNRSIQFNKLGFSYGNQGAFFIKNISTGGGVRVRLSPSGSVRIDLLR